MRLLFVLLVMITPQAMAGSVYSYVDGNGVRVFTNLGGSHSRRGTVETTGQANVAALAPSRDFTPLIGEYSSLYGVDESLVRAIIQVESSFDPNAVSPKNCKGLMQLHPDTARRFGVEDIFNPAQNIEGGVKYLSYLMNSFGSNLDHVLAAYNAGENAVRKYQGIPPYSETVDYVHKVKSILQPSALTRDAPLRRNRKVIRLVQPDGNVLFTNLPTSW